MHDWNLLPNSSDFYFFYSIICLDSTYIILLEYEKNQEYKSVWPSSVAQFVMFCQFIYFLGINGLIWFV